MGSVATAEASMPIAKASVRADDSDSCPFPARIRTSLLHEDDQPHESWQADIPKTA